MNQAVKTHYRPQRQVEAYQIFNEKSREQAQKILEAPYLYPKVNGGSDYFYDDSVVGELFDDRVQRWVPIRSGDWVVREAYNHFVKYPDHLFHNMFKSLP